MAEKIINYEQKFDDDFRELFTKRLRENEGFCCELWSALANVEWFHGNDETKTGCGYSFREAGSLIASMLVKGNYMDWYCSGPIAVVSDHIAEKMASKGWRYVLWTSEKIGNLPQNQ
jgi:hypothetical protein